MKIPILIILALCFNSALNASVVEIIVGFEGSELDIDAAAI